MSRAARALLGALLGAILTLVLHPYSSSKLCSGIAAWGPAPAIARFDRLDSLDVLPQPKTLADFALWMEAGAQRLIDRHPTSPKDWANLTEAAARAARLEPSNAFWLQMRAAFYLATRNRPASRLAWLAASKKSRWDDGQTRKLNLLRGAMTERYGDAAWTVAIAYPRRSFAPAEAVEGVARDIARTSGLDSRPELDLRYATVLNGKLMRDGARSMWVSERGVATVELATYPPNLTSINSPRKLLLARTELFRALADSGMPLPAQVTDQAFKDNDSWLGYPTSGEAMAEFQTLAWGALLIVSVFGAFLVSAAIGWAIAAIAAWMRARPGWETAIHPPWIVAIGVASAAGVYALTQSTLSTIVVAAAAAFLTFSPERVRTRPDFDLGPLHGFLVLLLGLLIAASTVALLTVFSTAGHETLRAVDFPTQAFGEYRSATAVLALCVAIVVLLATSYALVHRIATPQVLVYTIDRLGRGMGWAGLVAAVLASPAMLLIDRHTSQELSQRIANEPVHYLVSE